MAFALYAGARALAVGVGLGLFFPLGRPMDSSFHAEFLSVLGIRIFSRMSTIESI